MKEKKRFIFSLVFPVFFLFLIWFLKFVEFGFDTDLSFLGVYPRKIKGLIGIFTSPLIHADIKHLFDNSIPVFFLSLSIFYFYREVAYKVFFIIYFTTGILVWLLAREAYHIGASGLIYGFASFLFVSGIVRKNRNLLSISLLVVFLYGGLVWGIFPYNYKISWESHLIGAVSGIFTAIKYRKQGPESDINQWPDDEEEESPESVSELISEEDDQQDDSLLSGFNKGPFPF